MQFLLPADCLFVKTVISGGYTDDLRRTNYDYYDFLLRENPCFQVMKTYPTPFSVCVLQTGSIQEKNGIFL